MKNLWIHVVGKLILENIFVYVCPAMTKEVRIFGVLYLENPSGSACLDRNEPYRLSSSYRNESDRAIRAALDAV